MYSVGSQNLTEVHKMKLMCVLTKRKIDFKRLSQYEENVDVSFTHTMNEFETLFLYEFLSSNGVVSHRIIWNCWKQSHIEKQMCLWDCKDLFLLNFILEWEAITSSAYWKILYWLWHLIQNRYLECCLQGLCSFMTTANVMQLTQNNTKFYFLCLTFLYVFTL